MRVAGSRASPTIEKRNGVRPRALALNTHVLLNLGGLSPLPTIAASTSLVTSQRKNRPSGLLAH